MASATFTLAAGGDGSTVSDDSNPTTGLANGGHRTRFVPALAQIVQVALRTMDWATKTSGTVYNGLYSAQEWAVGIQTRGVASGGSSRDWANYTGATVDNAGYSAKEHAEGTTVPTGSARTWAIGTPADGSAKDWATKTDAPVASGLYGARYYSNLAQAFSSSAINAPGTSATSTTSNTIGTGSKTFAIQTGKQFSVGQSMVAARTSAPLNQMVGIVTAFDSAGGSITIQVSSINGSGTYTDWTLSLTALASLSITDINTNAEYYLVFVAGGGQQLFNADVNTTPISYNPALGRLTVVSVDADNVTGDDISGPLIRATTDLRVPVGNTAARPTIVGAHFRLNTDTGAPEYGYNGAWSSFGDDGAVSYPNLSANKQLLFSDMGFVRISFTGAGYSVATPVGTAVLPTRAGLRIKNEGAFDFLLTDSTGRPLQMVPAYSSAMLFIYDRTTAAGAWSTLAANAENVFFSDDLSNGGTTNYGCVVQIDTTRYLCVRADSTNLFARVATVGPNSIVLGTEVSVTDSVSGVVGCKINTDKIALFVGNGNSAFIRVVSISGTTPTINAASATFGTAMVFPDSQVMCPLGNDKAIIAYAQNDATWRANVVTVSGTTPTVAAQTTIDGSGSGNYAGLEQLAADKAFLTWDRGAVLRAEVLTVSGTTITEQAEVSLDANNIQALATALIDTDKVAVAFGRNDSSGTRIIVATISGNTTTPATQVLVDPFGLQSGALELVKTDTNKALLVAGRSNSTQVRAITFTGTVPSERAAMQIENASGSAYMNATQVGTGQALLLNAAELNLIYQSYFS